MALLKKSAVKSLIQMIKNPLLPKRSQDGMLFGA
jgi:hypothetical protein